MSRLQLIVLGSGAAGAEKQALALSARLQKHLARAGAISSDAVHVVRVPLKPNLIFQKLPPALQLFGARVTQDPFFGYDSTEDQKQLLLDKKTTSKRVVIGCGRSTVALCAALKYLSDAQRDVFNIQIQHPRVALTYFDAIITPRHDVWNKSVPNQLPANMHLTYGTVCSMDHDLLQREGEEWDTVFSAYSVNKTCIAWLVGGPCRGFSFSESDAHIMTDQLLHIVKLRRSNASVLVTFSRRTPAQVQDVIRNRLATELNSNELYIWDGSGANPFNAMLHHATILVTTPDSISMTTEAIATGKPVFTLGSDRVSGKFRHFHDMLAREGFTHFAASLKASTIFTELTTHGREAIESDLEAITSSLSTQILQH